MLLDKVLMPLAAWYASLIHIQKHFSCLVKMHKTSGNSIKLLQDKEKS